MKYKYVVTHKGKEVFALNEDLIKKQKCQKNVPKIIEMHQTKLEIHDAIVKESKPKRLKELAQELTMCEFELQRLWGFSEDSRFHRFWNTPKCTCPRMDNDENVGVGHFTINRNCVLHGDL